MTSWMGNGLVPIDLHPTQSLLEITPFIQTKICTSSAFIYILALAPLTHSLVSQSPTPNIATVASFRYLNHLQVSSNPAGGPKSNYNLRNQVDCSSAKSFGCQFNLFITLLPHVYLILFYLISRSSAKQQPQNSFIKSTLQDSCSCLWKTGLYQTNSPANKNFKNQKQKNSSLKINRELPRQPGLMSQNSKKEGKWAEKYPTFMIAFPWLICSSSEAERTSWD